MKHISNQIFPTYRGKQILKLVILLQPFGKFLFSFVFGFFHLLFDLSESLDLLAEHDQLGLLGRQVELQVDGGLGEDVHGARGGARPRPRPAPRHRHVQRPPLLGAALERQPPVQWHGAVAVTAVQLRRSGVRCLSYFR